jgi:hypothetical protein
MIAQAMLCVKDYDFEGMMEQSSNDKIFTLLNKKQSMGLQSLLFCRSY